MRLSRVQIRNFRSLKSIDFEFPSSNILVLVGANNAGKTNIVRAIDLVCGDAWFSAEKFEDYDHYACDTSRGISIALTFDNGSSAVLSSEERWAQYLDSYGRSLRGRKVKDDFPSTYLGADRTLDKHLSFYDWTLIGRIRKAFHRRATASVSSDLEAKFEELVLLFERVPGFAEFKEDFGRFFTEMQADTPARLEIDFKPFTPSNYFKSMHIVATDPSLADEPVDLIQLGEGSRNVVLLALMRSYAANFRGSGELSGILALEEPEIFLHPQARRHLAGVLREIAAAGVQVVVSTHSASFVETEFFDSIGQVYKVPDLDEPSRLESRLTLVSRSKLREHCLATGVPASKVTEDNLPEFYTAAHNPWLNEAFFARFVVLVEGQTEEMALPIYLRAAGLDCDRQGVSVLGVMGKNQLPKYWRLLSLFHPPVVVVFDNDDDGLDEVGSPKEKRRSNLNVCTCLNLDLEEVVADFEGFRSFGPPEARAAVVVLRRDFESAVAQDFRSAFPDRVASLGEFEREARSLIKPLGDQNKGQLARFVARRIVEEFPDYVPGFAKKIADLAKNHLSSIMVING